MRIALKASGAWLGLAAGLGWSQAAFPLLLQCQQGSLVVGRNSAEHPLSMTVCHMKLASSSLAPAFPQSNLNIHENTPSSLSKGWHTNLRALQDALLGFPGRGSSPLTCGSASNFSLSTDAVWLQQGVPGGAYLGHVGTRRHNWPSPLQEHTEMVLGMLLVRF